MNERKVKLELFWTYKLFFEGKKRGKRLVIQNLLNIAAFVPYGVLLPCIIDNSNGRKAIITVATAMLLSAVIEGCQWIFYLGTFELDDIICNSLGAAIGFGLYCIARHIIREKEETVV